MTQLFNHSVRLCLYMLSKKEMVVTHFELMGGGGEDEFDPESLQVKCWHRNTCLWVSFIFEMLQETYCIDSLQKHSADKMTVEATGADMLLYCKITYVMDLKETFFRVPGKIQLLDQNSMLLDNPAIWVRALQWNKLFHLFDHPLLFPEHKLRNIDPKFCPRGYHSPRNPLASNQKHLIHRNWHCIQDLQKSVLL